MITGPCKVHARCTEDETAEPRMGIAESGNEQIALNFAVLDENDDQTGDTQEWVGTFDGGKAEDITTKAMRACGWKSNNPNDLRGIGDNIVELDIQWDEYKGDRRLRVKWVNVIGGGRIKFKKSLDADGKAALAARVAARMAAREGGGEAPTALPKAPF